MPRRPSRIGLVALAFGFAVTLPACGGRGRQPDARGWLRVPPTAPDTIIEDMYAESSIIRNTECISGAFLRDVIAVAFQPGATQEQRQAAIDMIGGRVIGGMAYAGGGEYYVRIAGDSTGEAVTKAVELLETLPQVYVAWVIIVPEG